jgi:outer membrane protein assembly factor BamB
LFADDLSFSIDYYNRMFDSQKTDLIKFFLAGILTLIVSQATFSRHLFKSYESLNICREFITNKLIDLEIASDNVSEIYIPLLDGRLLSLNVKDNSEQMKKHWESELGGEIISAPTFEDDSIYLALKETTNVSKQETSQTTALLSIDKLTGITKWKAEINVKVPVYLHTHKDKIFAIGENGSLSAHSKTGGRLIWQKSLGVELSSLPAFANGEIILGSSETDVLVLSMEDGRIIHKIRLPAPVTTILKDEKSGRLITGDKKGFLYSIDKKTGKKKWKFRIGAAISSVILTNAGFLISSLDNFLYLVSEKDGNLIWKRRLSGRMETKPIVFKDILITSATEDSTASVIDLKNGKLISRFSLEKGNVFSGKSKQAGSSFIFSTLQGILVFTLGNEDCPVKKDKDSNEL